MATATAALGTIVKAVGLKGEVKLLPGPDFWTQALNAETLVLFSGDDEKRSVHVDGYREKKRTYILKLSGLDTIDDAEAAVGGTLSVSMDGLDEAARPDRIMPFQLMGQKVKLVGGTVVGEVVDMLLGPAQDCLIVAGGDERFLVPYTPGVVVRIDIEEGEIEIDPPEGLLDFKW